MERTIKLFFITVLMLVMGSIAVFAAVSYTHLDQLLKNLDEDAMTRIKNSLVIDKIAKVENIKLEQKDLEAKFAQLGAAYGLKPQDLLKQLGQNPEVLASISQQAMNDKVREFLMNNNKVEIK